MRVRDLPQGTDTSLGDELIESVKQGMAILRGDAEPSRYYPAPSSPDVRAMRERLGMTQEAFAQRFGFSLGAVRGWEQGRSQPDRTARTLLRVIEKEPDAVERALRGT